MVTLLHYKTTNTHDHRLLEATLLSKVLKSNNIFAVVNLGVLH